MAGLIEDSLEILLKKKKKEKAEAFELSLVTVRQTAGAGLRCYHHVPPNVTS